MMTPELSHKAAKAICNVPIEEQPAFIKAVEKCKTESDIPEKYRHYFKDGK